jgi:hypothetical protein
MAPNTSAGGGGAAKAAGVAHQKIRQAIIRRNATLAVHGIFFPLYRRAARRSSTRKAWILTVSLANLIRRHVGSIQKPGPHSLRKSLADNR